MEAILSGPAGLGLVMEGEKAWLIRWDQPGELLETTLAYATRLFRGREGDLRRFTVNQPQEAFPHMDRLRRQAEALDLLFSALEVTLDEGFRRDVSQDLEQRLEEASVWHYLAGMLYSQPVPDLHACGVAIWSAEQVDALRLADFLKGVVSSQAEIQQARRAWDRIGDEIFSPATRPFYLQTLVESGLFYEFVLALRSGQTSDFQFRAVQALQALPNHRPIIQAWAASLPHTHQKRDSLPAEPKRHEKSHKETPNQPFDRGSQFARVQQIKDEIVALFNIRPLPDHKVEMLLDWLRRLQNRRGDEKFLAKSLTDLAVRAREANLPNLHLRLAQEAVDVYGTDGWAWAVLATAHRLHGRLKESMEACQKAIEFGARPLLAGERARAETLKAMNRLEEALAAYDAVIEQMPDDVVAQNGRAETLKAMNRQEESLAAYDAVIKQFPHDVVAQNGRADTLKAMNRLEESLAAYDDIVEQFPDNVVAQTGRAETLKAMNRLEESLAAYRVTQQRFPHDQVARYGESGVLLALGLADEALAVLADLSDPVTIHDWIALHIRGGIHLLRGELDEAEHIFRHGIKESFPANHDYFRSGLAVTLLRRKAYAMAQQELDTIQTVRLQPNLQLLRIHLSGLTHSQPVPNLLEQLDLMSKTHCSRYATELARYLRECLPMNDDILFGAAVSCLALAA